MKLIFFHADKHQTFWQVDPVNHSGHCQVFPDYSKLQDCKIFGIYQERQEWSWILCIWASKFSINWCYHFWWAWPDRPEVSKTTSMCYLCNKELQSRKSWIIKLMFCMLVNMKIFYNLILFLVSLVRHAFSTKASL